jgi:hypothetical protein
MTLDAAPGYLSAEDCRLADLIDLVSQKTDLADYPQAGRGSSCRPNSRPGVPAASAGGRSE